MTSPGFLFCCDPLRPTRTDSVFAEEEGAARRVGARTALVDHDALLAGDCETAVRRVPRARGRTGTGAG